MCVLRISNKREEQEDRYLKATVLREVQSPLSSNKHSSCPCDNVG